MSSTELALSSISQSNLAPSEKKSLIRHMLETGGAVRKRVHAHVHQGAHAVVAGGVAGLTGAVLGVVHAEKGLDIKGKIPADLLLAAAGLGGAVLMAGDPVACVAGQAAGATGLGVFTFRQTYAFAAEKKAAKGGVPTGFKMLGHTVAAHGDDFAGDIGEDPITALAKEL